MDKKRKWFHTADNTILDCPKVDYKYNRDTYVREKKIFWVISIIGGLIALIIICLVKNPIIQTVAGAFLGGILSLIVWLFTIRQQDTMNYELALIDSHIMKIDGYLEQLNTKTKFIDPEEEELIDIDNPDVGKRFLLLLGIVASIHGDEAIKSDNLKLKLVGKEDYNLNEYIIKSEELLINRTFYQVADVNTWEKNINWNYWYLDWQLDELKNKLKRYKIYIMCGNAPDDIRNGMKK